MPRVVEKVVYVVCADDGALLDVFETHAAAGEVAARLNHPVNGGKGRAGAEVRVERHLRLVRNVEEE